MKIGFDNERYLKEQSEEIRRRAGKYGRLYLEFGGKLMNDFHAARCLPGYDPNVKLRLLQSLKDQAEVILCLFAGDIEDILRRRRAKAHRRLKLSGARRQRRRHYALPGAGRC